MLPMGDSRELFSARAHATSAPTSRAATWCSARRRSSPRAPGRVAERDRQGASARRARRRALARPSSRRSRGNPFLARGVDDNSSTSCSSPKARRRARGRRARPQALAARRVRGASAARSTCAAQRRRPHQADQRLLRQQARHRQHRPQLAHGAEAASSCRVSSACYRSAAHAAASCRHRDGDSVRHAIRSTTAAATAVDAHGTTDTLRSQGRSLLA